jgi:hypothetical protein
VPLKIKGDSVLFPSLGRQTRFSTAVDKNGLFRYKLFGMVIESYFLFAHPYQTFTTLMQGQENGEGEKKTRCEMVGNAF